MPKNTASPGLVSEFDWLLPQFQAHMKIVHYFNRILSISDNRILKKVYKWDHALNKIGKIKTWSWEVKEILNENNLGYIFESQQIFPSVIVNKNLKESLSKKQQELVKLECENKPKLRTFLKIKDFGQISPHVGRTLSFVERKVVSQLRLGVLPLRLETARYLRPILPETERVCYCSSGEVENELHFMFQCAKYDDLRSNWLNNLLLPENFLNLSPSDKLNLVLNIPENIKPTARYLVAALDLRRLINKTY